MLQTNLHGTMLQITKHQVTGEAYLIFITTHKHLTQPHGRCLVLLKSQVGGTTNTLVLLPAHIQSFGIMSEQDIYQTEVAKAITKDGQGQMLLYQ